MLLKIDKSIYLKQRFSFVEQGKMLPGDVLLITAFISYVGCFTKQFRLDLLHKMWLPFVKSLDVSNKLYLVLIYY